VSDPSLLSAPGDPTIEVFGPYQVRELLGRGGMGQVHRAYDTVHDRMVALKRLSAAGDDDEFRARFRRESKIVASLRHPNIIPIHDYGDIDGQLYLDMRLVRGTDLAHLVAAGPLSHEHAVTILTQVAAALDAAHADGVVHRDIKPSNILLDEQEHAYLADFGIARLATPDATKLTLSGILVGSLDYIAPERLTAGPVDGRSDVYSLACVLFECLTGRPPRSGNEPAAKLAAHLHEPPPLPTRTNPAVPAGFDAVIARGMARDPRQRFATAGELLAAAHAASNGTLALTEVARNGDDTARATRRWLPTVVGNTLVRPKPTLTGRPSRRPILLTSVAVVIAVVITTAVVLVDNMRNKARIEAEALSRRLAAESRQLATTDPVGAKRKAVQAWHASTTSEARSAVLAAQVPPTLARSATSPAFHPRDGSVAAVDGTGTVFTWNPADGTVSALSTIPEAMAGGADAVRFAADGSLLVVGTDENDDLLVGRFGFGRGSYAERLPGREAKVGNRPVGVAVTPNGTLLAVSHREKTPTYLGGYEYRITVWETGTMDRRADLDPEEPIRDELVFSTDRLFAETFGEDTRLRVWQTGDFSVSRNAVARKSPYRGVDLSGALVPDSDDVILAGATGIIEIRDYPTGELIRGFGEHPGPIVTMVLSPDGRTIATVAENDPVIRLWDLAEGRQVAELPGGRAAPAYLAFSPDSRALVSAGFGTDMSVWRIDPGDVLSSVCRDLTAAGEPNPQNLGCP
jgi:hypothetical protein